MTERVLKLVEESGVKGVELAAATGLSKNVVSEWKKGRIKPSAEAVVKLANYFNVSTDYLLGLTNTPNPIPPDTAALLEENTQLKEQLLIKDKQLAVIQAALKNE